MSTIIHFHMEISGSIMSDNQFDSNSHVVAQEIVGGIAHMSTLPEVTMQIIDIIEAWEKLRQKFIDVKHRDPLTPDVNLEILFGILTPEMETYYRKQYRQNPS